VVREADRRLKNLPRRAVDGEDIAQQAFAAFFRGVAANRFSQLEDRHDLWQVLVMLADRRANDHLRHELGPEHGGGRVRGDSALERQGDRSGSGAAGFDNIAAPPVTSESADALIQLIQRTFPELADEELQQIVLDRAANYSVAEIAERRGIALRTTERKLELIRQILERSAEDAI